MRRLLLSLAAFAIWVGITVFTAAVPEDGTITLADLVTKGVNWSIAGAGAFLLALVLWHGWRDVGLDRPVTGAAVRLSWLPLVYIVAGLGLATILGLPPASLLLLVLLNSLLVGFSEELMFRGVLLQAFRGVLTLWPAVLLTSVMFGAVHSLNVFVTGELGTALIQSVAAFLSGLFFIALRLRSQSLWPPILVHGLWDFTTFAIALAAAGRSEAAAGGAPPAYLPILLVLPNAIYGLWLMRNLGRDEAR
jgi:membrane protease YdiL (CAAX protease family)